MDGRMVRFTPNGLSVMLAAALDLLGELLGVG